MVRGAQLGLVLAGCISSGCVTGVQTRPTSSQARQGPGASLREPRSAATLLEPKYKHAAVGVKRGSSFQLAGYWHWDGHSYVWIPEQPEVKTKGYLWPYSGE